MEKDKLLEKIIPVFNVSQIQYYQLFNKKMNLTENNSIILQEEDHLQKKKNLSNLLNSTPQLNSSYTIFENTSIVITSGFESSNIHIVSVKDREISILLNSDTNTKGCTQWFYFEIQHKSDQLGIFKFKILNNRRYKSLLSQQTSNHLKVYHNGQWHQNCLDVFYYKTNINHQFYHNSNSQIAKLQKNIAFFTLEFNYNLNPNEKYKFAFSQPYTVTDLLSSILALEQNLHSKLSDFKKIIREKITYKRKIIGRSVLQLPIIKIIVKYQERVNTVVILARQHPSETCGSLICEKILSLLLEIENEDLLTKFKFIIFPMVNPDGVFIGNSRTNLNGYDLNRHWLQPNIKTVPEVYYIKKDITKYKIDFLIDLHGHSTEMNQFIYGCQKEIRSFKEYMHTKLFCKFLSSPYFNYNQSKFKVTKDKISTARVALWKQLNIKNSLTVETSLYGYIQNDISKPFHSYIQLAQNILSAILKYKMYEIEQLNKENENLNEVFDQEELQQVKKFIQKGINPIEFESSADSDSEGEIDLHIKKGTSKKKQFRIDKSSEQKPIIKQLKPQPRQHSEQAHKQMINMVKQTLKMPSRFIYTDDEKLTSAITINELDGSYKFQRFPIHNIYIRRLQQQKKQLLSNRSQSNQSSNEKIHCKLPEINQKMRFSPQQIINDQLNSSIPYKTDSIRNLKSWIEEHHQAIRRIQNKTKQKNFF